MERHILVAGVMAAAVSAIGCQSRATDAAVNGAPPAVTIPVGPVPGPGAAAPQPTDPYAGSRIAIMQGRQLFINYNCYGCHGGHGGGGMGPSLRDADWIYGDSDAHVFSSIAEGRAHGMPAWGSKVPQDQIWKLVAYIKSLNTPDEASPPPPFPGATPSNTKPNQR